MGASHARVVVVVEDASPRRRRNNHKHNNSAHRPHIHRKCKPKPNEPKF